MNSHPEEESVDEGYDENGYDRPSKSQVKREMHALLDLGKQLIALSPERLKQLPLAERLYEAIRMAQRTTSREGLRRQTHFVGKLRDAPPRKSAPSSTSGKTARARKPPPCTGWRRCATACSTTTRP